VAAEVQLARMKGLKLVKWQNAQLAKVTAQIRHEGLQALIDYLVTQDLQPYEDLNSRDGLCFYHAVTREIAKNPSHIDYAAARADLAKFARDLRLKN